MADDEMQNGHEVTYDRVICIGVDGNHHSEYAVDFYFDNLHKPGDFLILACAFDDPVLHGFQSIYVAPSVWDITMGQEEKRLYELKEHFRQKLLSKNIAGKFVARNGKAGEVLVQISDDEGADMILVGTREHGKLHRAILGSVSDHVRHHAHCSVMVCREPARSRTSSESRSRSNSDSYAIKTAEGTRKRTTSENTESKSNEP